MFFKFSAEEDIEYLDSDDDEEQIPVVTVGDLKIPVNEVNDAVIATMTPTEKEAYIVVYQNYFDMD